MSGAVRQSEPFLPLPKALVADRRPIQHDKRPAKPLNRDDKWVWCVLKWWDWGDKHQWEPTYELIAEMAQMSERQAKACVKRLELAGWLRVLRRPGKPNTWDAVTERPEGVEHPQDTKRAAIARQLARGAQPAPEGGAHGAPVHTVHSGGAHGAPLEGDGGAHGAPTGEKGRTERERPHPRAGAREGDGQGALTLQGQETPKPRRRGKRPLPADWTPTAQHAAIAAERGIDLAEQADQFRDYCAANGRHYADHDAAFRKWLRSGYQQPTSSAPAVNGNGGRVFLTAQEQRYQREQEVVGATVAELAAAGVFRDR